MCFYGRPGSCGTMRCPLNAAGVQTLASDSIRTHARTFLLGNGNIHPFYYQKTAQALFRVQRRRENVTPREARTDWEESCKMGEFERQTFSGQWEGNARTAGMAKFLGNALLSCGRALAAAMLIRGTKHVRICGRGRIVRRTSPPCAWKLVRLRLSSMFQLLQHVRG